MIDVVLTASTLDICQEENNDYGEQVYETACRLAATTLVLVGPDSIIAYQAMSAPMDMATLYETFRMHGGHLRSMLPTTISVEIFNLLFRFERREQTENGIPVMSPSACLNTTPEHGPGNGRGRRTGRIRM